MIWPIHWEILTYFEVLSLSLVREELSCLLPRVCEPGCQGSERQGEGGGWQSHHQCVDFHIIVVFNIATSSLSLYDVHLSRVSLIGPQEDKTLDFCCGWGGAVTWIQSGRH